MLDDIRSIVPESARGGIYAAVGAIAPALISWGVLGEQQAAAIAGVLAAVVTLAFAIVHGTSNVRNAVYGLLGAATVALTAWGYGTGVQWESILAIVAPVLGIGIAGATTPTGSEYVGEHRAVDGEV